ncbi:hypothetical protein I7I50_05821 [Histoplasma capsulatum G186AR]|uniref:Uncharacterized protein n=1 Tax=Ajellomyces capsulatus TaxID=5037 RepID=A0A8H7ZAB7_AJECA|nr:hypothetical protein I7I52_04080 [Histoplasma capsulatum]QSS76388.1 hypothetical protein I7I50_05821 [Histoplasma capsulatum G186AR]
MLYNDLRTPGLEPFRLGQTITATNPLPASPLRPLQVLQNSFHRIILPPPIPCHIPSCGEVNCSTYSNKTLKEVHASEELKKLSNSPVPVATRSCHYATCEMEVPFPLYQSPSDHYLLYSPRWVLKYDWGKHIAYSPSTVNRRISSAVQSRGQFQVTWTQI